MNPLLNRISVDPDVCSGKPCVRGTRIWVSLLLDFLDSGTTTDQILEEYPQLTRDDILAAIAYGAEMRGGRFVQETFLSAPDRVLAGTRLWRWQTRSKTRKSPEGWRFANDPLRDLRVPALAIRILY
jgi:uncharacterized protein (DUF433 family)